MSDMEEVVVSCVEEKVVEVLTEKINQLEQENETLSDKVQLFEGFANYGWLLHKEMSVEENGQLPLPRLEMRFEREGEYGFAMVYGIVRKHYVNNIEFIPLSKTTTSCYANETFQRVKSAIQAKDYETINNALPFRDGVHIKYDSMSLGMPIVIRCEKCVCLFDVSKEDKNFINRVISGDG